MLLIKLAFRNLRTNLRRTLITSSAIAVGLLFLIFGTVSQDGAHREMVRSAISMMAGHIIVQGDGYQEKRESDLVVTDARNTQKKLQDAFPGTTVLPRVFLQGLLTSPEGAMGVGLTAVDPAVEKSISDFDEKIVEGHYLSDNPRDIVIGKTLGETLDVTLGDKVVFMMQVKGVVQSRLFRVSGIFRTGADSIDGFAGVVSLKAGQELLGIENAVNQLALILDYDTDLDEAAQQTASALQRDDVEILNWQEAMPEVYEYILIDDLGLWIFLMLIGIMVAIGILNTMLMSVFERIRIMGTMMALGMKPKQLALLVFWESAILGVFASTVGTALGIGLCYPVVKDGLDYAKMMGVETMEVAGIPMNLLIYGYYDWPKFVIFFFITVLLTILAGLYPIWWTSKLSPIRAMQHR